MRRVLCDGPGSGPVFWAVTWESRRYVLAQFVSQNDAKLGHQAYRFTLDGILSSLFAKSTG
jgi:hypothetical protein